MGSATTQPPQLERFSFRHDMTIEMIRDLLSKHHAVRVLDCGCNDASLLMAIERAGLPIQRIDYFGLDRDSQRIQLARARFKKHDIRLRELPDLDGYPAKSFDLIVVNNILHEIPVDRLPHLLERLNSLLARPHGQLMVVDMEELPPEDPFEQWAVMWTVSEVERFMRGGNWAPQGTSHPKRVMSYKVVASPIAQVDLHGMVRCLGLALAEKRRSLLDQLGAKRDAGDIGEAVARLACKLAAVEVSLHRLAQKKGR